MIANQEIRHGYTLAAVLGYAARKYGGEVARDLANFADDVIENGDDNGVNADVTGSADE